MADDQDRIIQARARAASPDVAAEADRDRVVDVLTAAFADDPLMDWFMRDDERRTEVRRRLLDIVIGTGAVPHGHVLVSGRDAVAAWLPPGATNAMPTIGEQVRMLPDILRMTAWRRLPRLLAIMDGMPKHHPKAPPHFYLYFLGVTPDLRGKGVGSQILEASLARIDALGLPAFLENSNPRNDSLYRRYGFRSQGVYRVRPDAPPLDPMWREPGGR